MTDRVRPEIARLQKNIEQVIKGKSEVVKDVIIGILARGHVLLEDVPGVGKTTLAHLVARSVNVSFARIQFTSDMLPSDILGVTIYNQTTREFEFKPGPLFSNIVLADEINRTTPKTQSALLEAMNVAQVSVEKHTFDLPQPFMVIATQNPVEFHGTFPLPKSQMDRFLLRVSIGYPGIDDEVTILREQHSQTPVEAIQPVLSSEDMIRMQSAVEVVKIEEDLLKYIARIVAATRSWPQIELGASTRAALALRRAAQARAYYEGRDYCVPDDVKEMVIPVLAHRIQLYRALERDGFAQHEEADVLKHILREVEVPL